MKKHLLPCLVTINLGTLLGARVCMVTVNLGTLVGAHVCMVTVNLGTLVDLRPCMVTVNLDTICGRPCMYGLTSIDFTLDRQCASTHHLRAPMYSNRHPQHILANRQVSCGFHQRLERTT